MAVFSRARRLYLKKEAGISALFALSFGFAAAPFLLRPVALRNFNGLTRNVNKGIVHPSEFGASTRILVGSTPREIIRHYL